MKKRKVITNKQGQAFISVNVAVRNLAIREEVYEGKKHLVAPVVILVEGVHYGSGGPLLYTAEELRKFPEAWNGVPVPVLHPTDEEGNPVCCNEPDILEEYKVGQLFHTYWDEGSKKLRSEIYIDIAAAQEKSSEILGALYNGTRLEVSTGLFSDTDGKPGTWNGEEYMATVKNIRPEHLALLPNSTGACSWKDGCGVRDNEAPKKQEKDFFCNLKKNKPFFEEIQRNIRAFLASKENFTDESNYLYAVLRATDDEGFVYEEETNEGIKFFKQSYTIDKNGMVKVSEEEPIEVAQEVNYFAVTKNEKGEEYRYFVSVNQTGNPQTINLEKGENTMAKKDVIDKLVTEKIFNEEDRESLEGMEECHLQKYLDVANAAQQKEEKKTPAPEETPATNKDEEETVEDVLSNVKNPDVKAALLRAVNADKAKKKVIVANLMKAEGNQFSEEVLNTFDLDVLEGMEALLPKKDDEEGRTVNYAGRGGGRTEPVDNEQPVEPLTLPVVEEK